MQGITATRARQLLGLAGKELSETELEATIEFVSRLAEVAVKAYVARAQERPTDAPDDDTVEGEVPAIVPMSAEVMDDRMDALMSVGFSLDKAQAAVRTHYTRRVA